MVQPANNRPITTISGRFYAGMTKAQAQKNGTYQKTVGMDFRDIDTNKDGRLSDKEICDARDKEVARARDRKRMSDGGLIMSTAGSYIFGTGFGAGVGLATAGVGAGLTLASFVGDKADGVNCLMSDEKLDKEIAKTAVYRNEHHLDTKM